MAMKPDAVTLAIAAKRGRGRPPETNSARNGGVRVTCVVSPEDAATIAAACAKSGLTRGELISIVARELIP